MLDYIERNVNKIKKINVMLKPKIDLYIAVIPMPQDRD